MFTPYGAHISNGINKVNSTYNEIYYRHLNQIKQYYNLTGLQV